jgi:TM2 domain-containing membrane protein YozV
LTKGLWVPVDLLVAGAFAWMIVREKSIWGSYYFIFPSGYKNISLRTLYWRVKGPTCG